MFFSLPNAKIYFQVFNCVFCYSHLKEYIWCIKVHLTYMVK